MPGENSLPFQFPDNSLRYSRLEFGGSFSIIDPPASQEFRSRPLSRDLASDRPRFSEARTCLNAETGGRVVGERLADTDVFREDDRGLVPSLAHEYDFLLSSGARLRLSRRYRKALQFWLCIPGHALAE